MMDGVDDYLRAAAEDLRTESDVLEPPEFQPRRSASGPAIAVVLVLAVLAASFIGLRNLGDVNDRTVTIDEANTAEPTDPEEPPDNPGTEQTPAAAAPITPVPVPPALRDAESGTDALGPLAAGPLPALVASDPEGSPDPDFGTPIVRVTESEAGSITGPTSLQSQVFNANGSLFILTDINTGEAALYDGTTLREVGGIDLGRSEPGAFSWHHTDPDRLFYVDRPSNEVTSLRVSTGERTVAVRFDCDSVTVGFEHSSTANGTAFMGVICQRGDDNHWAYFDMNDSSAFIAADPTPSGIAPVSASLNGERFVVVENEAINVLDSFLRPLSFSPIQHTVGGGYFAITVDRATGNPVLVAPSFSSTDRAPAGSVVGFDLESGEEIVFISSDDYAFSQGVRMSSSMTTGLVAITARPGDRVLDGELFVLTVDSEKPRVSRLTRTNMSGTGSWPSTDYRESIPALGPDGHTILFTSDWQTDTANTFAVRLGG